MTGKPERIEIKLVHYFKEDKQGIYSKDVYSLLRMTTGDWEKDRLRYIKAMNKLQEDLNVEENLPTDL